MFILVLCYEYPPLGGGGGVGVKKYAEAWAERGHRVTVVTSRAGGLPATEEAGGVRVVRVQVAGKDRRATSTSLAMFTYLASALRHILERRAHYSAADVINTHFALPTGPLGWTASNLLSVPNVLTIIGGDIYDPTKRSSPHRHFALRAVNRFLMRSAARVVAISSDTRERADRHYSPGRPIDVINYGFDPPSPSAVASVDLPDSAERYYLASVGRLVPRKGFRYLIRAVSSVSGDVHLLLVGDGPQREALEDAASRWGVSGRTHFLGYQESSRVLGYLKAADCFVLPSLHEGLGIVVQEAMWAGLPIVATSNGGQVDLLEDRRNALLVPPGDVDALAEGIRSVRGAPRLQRQMSRANRKDLGEQSIEARARDYLELFAEVSGERLPGPEGGRAPPTPGREEAVR